MSKSRVEKLEEKLDGLVTLLKNTNREAETIGNTPLLTLAVGSKSPDRQPVTSRSISISTSDVSEGRSSMQEQPPKSQQVLAFQLGNLGVGTGPTNLSSALPSSIESDFDEHEANLLLAIFRDEMCPNFPFIVVHESTSAQDIRRERPFLYLTILAVTTRKTAKQLELGDLVMKELAERMMVNGERSLDLLLGVLTYASCMFEKDVPWEVLR